MQKELGTKKNTTMFHFSTVVVHNPQPHKLFPPLPIFPSATIPRKLQSLRTLKFPTKWSLHSLSQSSLYPPHQHHHYDDDSEEQVIGDCVVFEEGIFEDPIFQNGSNSDNIGVNEPKPSSKKKKMKKNVGMVASENLVPDKWREVQAEINITKKDRRKIAREIEFNSKVEKKKRGLVPLRDMNLDDYNAYKEAKLAQLRPLVLDNTWIDGDEDEDEEEEVSEGEGGELSDGGGGKRVEPKNPRWAVYGRGLEDVSEFFNSGNYDTATATAKTPEGISLFVWKTLF